jgi:hypothetical protein
MAGIQEDRGIMTGHSRGKTPENPCKFPCYWEFRPESGSLQTVPTASTFGIR